MPPKGKRKTQNKEQDDIPILSKEDILSMVESKMSEVFEVQYEDLKDKLITLIAKEVSKLKHKVENIEEELQQFKQSQASSTVELVENSKESQAVQLKKTEVLTENITRISDQLRNIEVDVEDTKQILKERNVRLVGLQESESEESDEDLKSKVINFSKQHLKFSDVGGDDIEVVNRLGKKTMTKPRDVIIKFKHRDVRNRFYQNRKQLYNHDTKRSSSDMYVNEDLTQYRQRLYFDARNLRKKAAIYTVWTSSGTIMIKVEENSVPTPIKTHRDLANLLRQNRIEVQDD